MLLINGLNGIVPVNRAGTADQRKTGGYSPFVEGLKPGQRVPAIVQSRLPGGEFVVALDVQDRAERQLLHMKLPAGTRQGNMLNLIFVSREPRLAFMLVPGTTSNADSAPLSETGRFIDGLLRRSIPTGSPTILPGAAPLLPAPPVDGVQLARNLARALGRSGLFYESHQAQWIAGTRALAELFLEPQVRLSQSQLHLSQPPALLPLTDVPQNANLPNAAAVLQDYASGTDDPVVRNGLFYEPGQAQRSSIARRPVESLREPQARLFHPLASPPDTDIPPNAAATVHDNSGATQDPVHPDALAMVRQQLEIFETRSVGWQGVAWPGQTIEWEVAEEKPETADEGAEPPAVWNTRLNLTLPNLGHVSARVRLDTNGVEVGLTAEDPVSGFMLRTGGALLEDRLKSAGIKLLRMGIGPDE